jgi:hypothetical protein
MPYKQVLFRSEAREKILRGATTLADAVRVTLGPKSKCVLIPAPAPSIWSALSTAVSGSLSTPYAVSRVR